jgi:hypothetical protein
MTDMTDWDQPLPTKVDENDPYVQTQIEAMAQAIYMTHWREPSPVWQAASENVKDWVRAQALAAMNAQYAMWCEYGIG